MAKAVGWTFMGIEYETGKEARSDQETYLRGVFRESYKKKLDVLQGNNYYVNYFKNSSCLFLIPLRDVNGNVRTAGAGMFYNEVYKVDFDEKEKYDHGENALIAIDLFYKTFKDILQSNNIDCSDIVSVKIKTYSWKNDVDFVVEARSYIKKSFYFYITYNINASVVWVFNDSEEGYDVNEDSWNKFAEFVNSKWNFGERIEISLVHVKDLCANKIKDFLVEDSTELYKQFKEEMSKKEEYKVCAIYERTDVENVLHQVVGNLFRVSGDKASFIGMKGVCGIQLETNEEIEVQKYKVFDGGMVRLNNTNISVNLVEEIKNIKEEVVGYGIRNYERVHYGVNLEKCLAANGYYSMVSDTYEECMSYLRSLDGKNASEKNYFKEALMNTKYYRYAGLKGVKDYKFSTYMFLEEGVCAFLRYSGTLKVIFLKPGCKREDLVEHLKKAVKIPVVRKLLIKKEYVFNIYETSSTIAARLNINKTYIGRQVDLSKFLEESKSSILKDVVFSISCINKRTKKIEQDIVVRNGNILSIDGCTQELNKF